MRKPEYLKINSTHWRILEDSGLETKEVWGSNNPKLLEMRLDPQQADERWVLTMLHEAIHIMLLDKEYNTIEDICNALSHQFKNFIEDNPEAIKALFYERLLP